LLKLTTQHKVYNKLGNVRRTQHVWLVKKKIAYFDIYKKTLLHLTTVLQS